MVWATWKVYVMLSRSGFVLILSIGKTDIWGLQCQGFCDFSIVSHQISKKGFTNPPSKDIPKKSLSEVFKINFLNTTFSAQNTTN